MVMNSLVAVVEEQDGARVLSFPGLDLGVHSRFKFIAENVSSKDCSVIVILVPGHRYWTGRCMERSYMPATYYVYHLTRKRNDRGWKGRGTRYDALLLLSWSARPKGEK
jgi:hypothetical protein